jgi:inner membrane protein
MRISYAGRGSRFAGSRARIGIRIPLLGERRKASTNRHGWAASPDPNREPANPPTATVIYNAPSMQWWHWLAVGLILVALEMAASGGFYVIFFGIAALAIGGLHLFDLAGPVWFQFLLFSVLSVASLALFRSRLMKWLDLDQPGQDLDTVVGDIALPLDDIVPGAVGRAELRGTVWSARNTSPLAIIKGQRCRVVRVNGLMIFLEPEGAQ